MLVRVDPNKRRFEDVRWIRAEDVNVKHLLKVFTSVILIYFIPPILCYIHVAPTVWYLGRNYRGSEAIHMPSFTFVFTRPHQPFLLPPPSHCSLYLEHLVHSTTSTINCLTISHPAPPLTPH